MNDKGQERIHELEFEYNETQYRFVNDELLYKNRYGVYEVICEIPISYTKYANDKEVIKYVCQMAMCIYAQGIEKGKSIKASEIRNLLGVKE